MCKGQCLPIPSDKENNIFKYKISLIYEGVTRVGSDMLELGQLVVQN